MKTDLTAAELDMLAEAYWILGRLGRQTALPNPEPDSDAPVWDTYVDRAHYNLARTLTHFCVGRWEGCEPWAWRAAPTTVREPSA